MFSKILFVFISKYLNTNYFMLMNLSIINIDVRLIKDFNDNEK